jgi:hypothetical protein
MFAMLSVSQRLLLAAFCAAGLSDVALAQTGSANASPFGKANAQQTQQAVQADTAQLSALAAYAQLPAAQQERLTAQMATMTEAQRLELLQTVPSLRNLTPEGSAALLANIAQATPYPVSLTIQPQEVHFLAGYRSAQLTPYLNNVALSPTAVLWSPISTGPTSAVVVDTTGKVFLRPSVQPTQTSPNVLITATKADEPTVQATALATAHVATMQSTAPSEVQISGGTQLSTVVSIDARVPDPQGPVTGTVSFFIWIPTQFNSNNKVLLCTTGALQPVAPATAGVHSSTAGCVSQAISTAGLRGTTGPILAQHNATAGYPKQGIFHYADPTANASLVP